MTTDPIRARFRRKAALQQLFKYPHPVAAQDFLNLHIAESTLD
jgi:hypothetical protein